MSESEFNISNAELFIMRIVWSLGEARVNEIYAQIPQELDWSLATVKTLLGRLVKKEMLGTEKEGRKFVYRPLMAECAAINLMADGLLEKVCTTKHVKLLQDMIEKAQLTDDDVAVLKQVLTDKKTVAEKHCSCLETTGACKCQHENASCQH